VRAEHTLFSNTAGLVVEDAPSGLLAGRRAGARTLAMCTSHTRDKIVASGVTPDFIVDDLTKYENQAVLPCPGTTLMKHLLGFQ
jgi:beta-phosphoglucomutase-like phosphatase (HAD superfamily)